MLPAYLFNFGIAKNRNLQLQPIILFSHYYIEYTLSFYFIYNVHCTHLRVQCKVVRELERVSVLLRKLPELLTESDQHAVQPSQHIRAVVVCLVAVYGNPGHQSSAHFLVEASSYVLDVSYRVSPAEGAKLLAPCHHVPRVMQ